MSSSASQAVRRLARARGFTVAAVSTLMLGIGASTAVFSVVNGVLLRPLPYDRPEQLVDLSHTLVVSGVTSVDQSDASYLYYRRANRVFSGVAAYRGTAVNLSRPGGTASGADGHAERVSAALVSASAFGVLRAAPLGGRVFRDAEDHPDAVPVVIIGERLWKRSYASDPAIIGQRLEIDGVTREVVGIMPARFRFPAANTDLWLPIAIDPAKYESATFGYRAVARLRAGVSLDAASTDLNSLLPRLPESFPGRLTAAAIAFTKMRVVVRPLRDVVVGDIDRVLWVLLGAVGFVLLIACANVANLFLVRAESRQQELAIRRALGAGRLAIVGDLFSEGIILAMAGGALGLALAFAGVGVLRSLESRVAIPRLEEVGVDVGVLAVAIGITGLAALLVTALPALRAAAGDVSVALGGAERSVTAGRRRHHVRHALVVAQTALALVLISGAGLMARSFERLRSVDPGFDAHEAWTFRVALPAADYPTADAATRLIVDALDRVSTLPGVRGAGVVTKLPLVDEARRDSALFVEDRPLGMNEFPNVHQVVYASPGYFGALAIPMVEGRTFERPDPSRARLEVVLSRAVVARYWPDGRAVGKRVRLSPRGDWFTIVGVVGSVHGTTLEQPPDETVYLPLVTAPGVAGTDARWTPRELAFVVRGGSDPAAIAVPLERTIRALAPSIPVYSARSMSDVVAQAGARTSFTLLLLGVASFVAMAIGAVGIYGVISYVVSLRRRELAVRLAIGARPVDVWRMVTRQSLGVAIIGIGFGLVGAAVLTRFLAALLFGVGSRDPAALAGAAILMLGVAVAASWIPARRAANVDPARALRAD